MFINVRKIVFGSLIAAIYSTLSIALAPISFGLFQFRVAEALCVLPFIAPYTMWGLFAGCVITNLYSMFGLLDVVLGSFATLAAGFLTSRIRIKWLAPLPPVIINGLVIGAIITFFTPQASFAAYPLMAGQVALEELVVVYSLGLPLILVLTRTKFFERSGLA